MHKGPLNNKLSGAGKTIAIFSLSYLLHFAMNLIFSKVFQLVRFIFNIHLQYHSFNKLLSNNCFRQHFHFDAISNELTNIQIWFVNSI